MEGAILIFFLKELEKKKIKSEVMLEVELRSDGINLKYTETMWEKT